MHSNNSAWNHRYFLIAQTTGFTEPVVQREISYALGKLRLEASNESGWNYLQGYGAAGRVHSVV